MPAAPLEVRIISAASASCSPIAMSWPAAWTMNSAPSVR